MGNSFQWEGQGSPVWCRIEGVLCICEGCNCCESKGDAIQENIVNVSVYISLMIHMRSIAVLAAFIVCAALTGCATISIETSGTTMKGPLYRSGGDQITVISFWQSRWRFDQKEPEFREAVAARGIQDFFSSTGCIDNFEICRLNSQDATDRQSDEELLKLASTLIPGIDRVFLITVRELGPNLVIGFPVIVKGGTEAVLDIRVIDAWNSESIANFRIHWLNDGIFVIKGVKTLPSDMKSTLKVALISDRE